ncbi:MAG: hypothetical protein GXP06_04330 [Alphaproteobacteria bacterium]|nr:hypothetical protein [Alphaproteobacteria bacterium]
MITVFDLYALALLLVSMSLFVHRYVRQNPPVYPYLIIAITCLVANWLGEAGGGIFAMTLLVAASFSFLGCLLYPSWRNMSGPADAAPTQSAEN